jgi:hypothetical protein
MAMNQPFEFGQRGKATQVGCQGVSVIGMVTQELVNKGSPGHCMNEFHPRKNTKNSTAHTPVGVTLPVKLKVKDLEEVKVVQCWRVHLAFPSLSFVVHTLEDIGRNEQGRIPSFSVKMNLSKATTRMCKALDIDMFEKG